MHIILESVTVEFPIASPQVQRLFSHETLGTLLGGKFSSGDGKASRICALNEIDVNITAGDRLALIGPNGAGKSTLLRVISGILSPTQGNMSVAGNVVPLLDSALALEIDATGYENIDIGCLYIGIDRDQIPIARKEIADFTELGPYLSMPVRTYSSGMLSRLTFAIATSLAPDILVVDEGIGAGDASFQKKAAERLDQYMGNTKILVLASHSERLIRTYCNKGLYMKKGEVAASGGIEEVLQIYKSDI